MSQADIEQHVETMHAEATHIAERARDLYLQADSARKTLDLLREWGKTDLIAAQEQMIRLLEEEAQHQEERAERLVQEAEATLAALTA